MIEKVNPSHPDKIADRIAGALVDVCYKMAQRPKCAFEVLIGHGDCYITGESSVEIPTSEIVKIVNRIAGHGYRIAYNVVPQDANLSRNQRGHIRCGDNGIFRGIPLTQEELRLSRHARRLYERFPTDGKYLMDGTKMVICQSHAHNDEIKQMYRYAIINPLGEWSGSPYVDAGATNRKLGSDMGQSVTGAGLHGKDLSKADVSVQIYVFLKAQMTCKRVELSCAIGDETIDGKSYEEIVKIAADYIAKQGGFEKFAEWGLL